MAYLKHDIYQAVAILAFLWSAFILLAVCLCLPTLNHQFKGLRSLYGIEIDQCKKMIRYLTGSLMEAKHFAELRNYSDKRTGMKNLQKMKRVPQLNNFAELEANILFSVKTGVEPLNREVGYTPQDWPHLQSYEPQFTKPEPDVCVLIKSMGICRGCCKPGSAGPRGRPGRPGVDGTPGRPGIPGSASVGSLVCDTMMVSIPTLCSCPHGEKGPPGLPGPIGDPGEPGDLGPQGLDGPPGPLGAMGVIGVMGPTGKDGAIGHPGRTPENIYMEPGDPGPGVPGSRGQVGPRGDSGIDGDYGPPGERGAPGEEGKEGLPGHPGAPGPPGLLAAAGRKGRCPVFCSIRRIVYKSDELK